MTMALHHPTDRQDQTTSPALTMMREQVDDKDQTEVKMVPFTTEGEEGITKCRSTWPAHFATLAKLQLLPASANAACSFDLESSCDRHTLLTKL
jgi:hypothetical protein